MWIMMEKTINFFIVKWYSSLKEIKVLPKQGIPGLIESYSPFNYYTIKQQLLMQSLPAFGGAVGDQGRKDRKEKQRLVLML